MILSRKKSYLYRTFRVCYWIMLMAKIFPFTTIGQVYKADIDRVGYYYTQKMLRDLLVNLIPHIL